MTRNYIAVAIISIVATLVSLIAIITSVATWVSLVSTVVATWI